MVLTPAACGFDPWLRHTVKMAPTASLLGPQYPGLGLVGWMSHSSPSEALLPPTSDEGSNAEVKFYIHQEVTITATNYILIAPSGVAHGSSTSVPPLMTVSIMTRLLFTSLGTQLKTSIWFSCLHGGWMRKQPNKMSLLHKTCTVLIIEAHTNC